MERMTINWLQMCKGKQVEAIGYLGKVDGDTPCFEYGALTTARSDTKLVAQACVHEEITGNRVVYIWINPYRVTGVKSDTLSDNIEIIKRFCERQFRAKSSHVVNVVEARGFSDIENERCVYERFLDPMEHATYLEACMADHMLK